MIGRSTDPAYVPTLTDVAETLYDLVDVVKIGFERVDRLEDRFDGLERRFDVLEEKVDLIQIKLDQVSLRVDGIDERLENRERACDRDSETLVMHERRITALETAA